MDTPTSSASQGPSVFNNRVSDVPFAKSPRMVRLDDPNYSPSGPPAPEFSAHLDEAIYRRCGPLGAAIEKLFQKLLDIYKDVHIMKRIEDAGVVPEAVFTATSAFAQTSLTRYIRSGSTCTVNDLEEHTRLQTLVTWQGNYTIKWFMGWSDEFFVEKLVQAFYLVAKDCDLK